MGIIMSGCGCSKETPCEDKKSQQENHPSIAEASNSKNCDNTPSCCGEEEEEKSSSPCCNTSNSCEDTAQSCCGSDPKENLSTENVLKDSHYMSEYLVPKMDCSAEEQMVRMALSSIDGVQKLIFDLPNRSLKVLHNQKDENITTKLEALGFGAKLVKTETYISNQQAKQTSTYTIPKMDCSAEEQMVRMALADIEAVKGLTFDLPNRKLKVFHNEGIQQITAKLEGLGFGAKLDETQLSSGDIPNEPDPVRQAKVLKLLLGINALLFFIEFISGIIAASTGLIADSLDMFADAAVYGIALYAVGKAAKYQIKAAHFAGWIQLLLAVIVIVDVIRRFMFGSEPESTLMIVIGLLALIANVTCLYLISGHREDGAHMKASWIFSANDVVVNMGVIFAGVLVAWTGSAYPDLIIGILASLFVLNGARKILALK